ncbi:hypothetical protein B0F90DRAFT_1633362 [Multifurca ochricompacta]|uniref:DUF7729 domain-containing protein n=1 Tax=Multifurca ochricompacta TaxID=376703 RepID=A0AAD4QM19_9AGAM|nr:hypothetical protein B0F90DRAFT_1633362 [Multifurca ochricompacta]
MKSLAIISLFASLALAQTSSNSTTNPLIPSGISPTCQDFYVQLNANITLSECLKPLISATSQYAAGSNSTKISTSTISNTLNNLCSSSDACDPTLIGTQLALFYKACQPELSSSNKNSAVVIAYDVLYALGPLKKAVCQKDDSGSYCAANMTSSRTASNSTTAKRSSLERRDQVALVPNLDKYSKQNIPFLGLQTSLPADKLCTACTRNIMNVYTTQLNNVPYGPGISFSLLLSGQPALYAAINTKCGTSFLSGQVQAAGGLATGAAPRSADSTFALVGSAIAVMAAGAVAVL